MVWHLKHLSSRFGKLEDLPGLPLFPTAEGTTTDKEKVVATIEKAAAMLGEPLRDEFNNRLYGGHSLRVMGAQWMAALGISLLVIQLIARWASEVVLRYVAEAPLQSVTATYRRAQLGRGLQAVLDMAVSDQEDLKQELPGLKSDIRKRTGSASRQG